MCVFLEVLGTDMYINIQRWHMREKEKIRWRQKMSRFGKKHCGNVGGKPNFRRRLLWSECRADCGVVTLAFFFYISHLLKSFSSSFVLSFYFYFLHLFFVLPSFLSPPAGTHINSHEIPSIFTLIGTSWTFSDFHGIKWSDRIKLISQHNFMVWSLSPRSRAR